MDLRATRVVTIGNLLLFSARSVAIFHLALANVHLENKNIFAVAIRVRAPATPVARRGSRCPADIDEAEIASQSLLKYPYLFFLWLLF